MLQKQQNTSRNTNNFLVSLSIGVIEVWYRKIIKPLKAKHDSKKRRITICSYYPSCSEYGILALKKYGFLIGWYKTIKRVFSCNTYQHDKSCIDYP